MLGKWPVTELLPLAFFSLFILQTWSHSVAQAGLERTL